MLAAVILSKEINTICGGAVIAPWQISELPMDWIEIFRAVAERLPKIKQGVRKVQDIVNRWKEQRK